MKELAQLQQTCRKHIDRLARECGSAVYVDCASIGEKDDDVDGAWPEETGSQTCT